MHGMGKEKTPPLDDQLCFDLYAASRAVTSAYRPALRELGLTYPQYLVLIVLWDEETVTVRTLAERLRLDHGTLTPLLKRMEEADLITRRRASADERFVEVALTEHGDGLRQHATRIQCDMKEAMGLDAEGFAALQATLQLLTTRVSAARSWKVSKPT
jgi:DNA-binding MarR family transcriptional regulator